MAALTGFDAPDDVAEDLSSHLFDTVSHAELLRRWGLVAAAMEAAGIDALVMQNISDANGAYTNWFAGIQAHIGYPISLVFERDGTLTVHGHGSHGASRELPLPALAGARETPRMVTTWTFITAPFCAGYEPDALLTVLRRYARGTVGLVGTMQMTASFADGIRAGLPGATIVDASDLVDAIKVVKSPEELDGIRLCARIQEQVLTAMAAAAVPGVTEYDVVVAAYQRSLELGSDGGMIAFGSAPPGTPALMRPLERRSRVLEAGDRMTFLVECNGPGGWHTELGRTGVIGTADAQMTEDAALAAELQDFTLGLLQPGRPTADVFDAYSQRLRAAGIAPETRLFCHGQGLDIVERPLVRSDESMTLTGPVNLACHPGWARGDVNTWMCDNVIIHADGAIERLTDTPRVVLELG